MKKFNIMFKGEFLGSIHAETFVNALERVEEVITIEEVEQ